MNCSLGIFLSLITLLLIFTFLYIFYGIYKKSKKNRQYTELITPSQIFTSLIKDENDISEITKLSDIIKYKWSNSKKSGIGGPIQLESPDIDNFILYKNHNNWIHSLENYKKRKKQKNKFK